MGKDPKALDTSGDRLTADVIVSMATLLIWTYAIDWGGCPGNYPIRPQAETEPWPCVVDGFESRFGVPGLTGFRQGVVSDDPCSGYLPIPPAR